MIEKDLMALVIREARRLGWRVYHTHDSRRSEPGFPDLCMVRGGRVVYAELKSERGKLTAEQKRWLEDLRGAGQEAYMWRPADWPEAIGGVLTA